MFISKKKLDKLIFEAQDKVRNDFYKRDNENRMWSEINKNGNDIYRIKKAIAGLDRRIEALESNEKGGKK